jgi:fido (protein-threonine AMPylation protein)
MPCWEQAIRGRNHFKQSNIESSSMVLVARLQTIHPFLEANGRLSRLLTMAV